MENSELGETLIWSKCTSLGATFWQKVSAEVVGGDGWRCAVKQIELEQRV